MWCFSFTLHQQLGINKLLTLQNKPKNIKHLWTGRSYQTPFPSATWAPGELSKAAQHQAGVVGEIKPWQPPPLHLHLLLLGVSCPGGSSLPKLHPLIQVSPVPQPRGMQN